MEKRNIKEDLTIATPKFMIMAYLAFYKSATVKEVVEGLWQSEGLHYKVNNVTGIMNRLVDHGLATREGIGAKNSGRKYALSKMGHLEHGHHTQQLKSLLDFTLNKAKPPKNCRPANTKLQLVSRNGG